MSVVRCKLPVSRQLLEGPISIVQSVPGNPSLTPKAEQPSRTTLRRLFKITLWTIQRILAGLGLLLLIVTVTPLDAWWVTHLAGPRNDPTGDVLIVLGGASAQQGVIGENSYWRAAYAVRTWREGGFRAIVLTGGGPPGHSIAEAMRDFLVAQGVPQEVIRVETRSRSTRENALFAKPILDGIPGRKILLTSDYHMYRARRVFQRVGLEVLPRPSPDIRRRAENPLGRWDAFLELGIETVKISYYYLRGWI